MLQNPYLLAKIGFDIAENGPPKGPSSGDGIPNRKFIQTIAKRPCVMQGGELHVGASGVSHRATCTAHGTRTPAGRSPSRALQPSYRNAREVGLANPDSWQTCRAGSRL